jgi:hypothetical protein
MLLNNKFASNASNGMKRGGGQLTQEKIQQIVVLNVAGLRATRVYQSDKAKYLKQLLLAEFVELKYLPK